MASDDNLLNLLLGIARDSFPNVFKLDAEILLIAPESWQLSIRDLLNHPNSAEFAEAIRDDRDFAVFTEKQVGAFIHSNLGGGSRMQASILPVSLVASAARAVIAKGLSTTDAKLFEEEVRNTYDSFRRLVRGETCPTLVLVGFDGLTLAENSRLDLTWGSLRPCSRLERYAAPFGLAPTCVLEVSAELRYEIGEPAEPARRPLPEHPEAASRAWGLLGLAALLGVPRTDPLSPAAVWQTTIYPGFSGSSFAGGNRRSSGFHPLGPSPREGGDALDEREAESLIKWAQIVQSRYDPSIDIAVRRITLALLERMDAADSLVDAVIALENLFGHGGTTEVGFRLTTAAAHLLEPDPALRRKLRTELGDVYDLRSRVLHGDALKPKDDLAARKEKAIETVISSLRVLFSDQPHLIPDRQRGIRLILGDTGP